MGNCTRTQELPKEESVAPKSEYGKVTILTFSGPNAFRITDRDSHQTTFSEPVFFGSIPESGYSKSSSSILNIRQQ